MGIDQATLHTALATALTRDARAFNEDLSDYLTSQGHTQEHVTGQLASYGGLQLLYDTLVP